MEIFRDSKDLKPFLQAGAGLTVGTFDGVHLGHKKLIEYLVEGSKKHGLKSVVLTFEPHPIYVLRPEIKVERIALPDEKIARLSNFGLDYLLILNFNTNLANFKAIQFFDDILIGDLNTRFIALGFNHTFGKNKEGNLEYLKGIAPQRCCQVSAVDPYVFGDANISSSRIRNEVKTGGIEMANKMLTLPFTIPGLIVKGKGLGHKLGYPTINVKVDSGKLLPNAGVYAASVEVSDQNIPGMMYVHPEPDEFEIEVNLFGFEGDIYDKRVVIYPHKFTREAVKFPNYDGLIKQLDKDEIEIKHYFGIS
jgi:riboflavin kinase / FMN adenylyltransferase